MNPAAEGVHARSERPIPDAPASQRRELSAAASLVDLVDDWVLFSPVLLFTHGFLVDDPLHDLKLERGDLELVVVDLPLPWVDGLGDPAWSRRLHLVPRGEAWEAVRDYLLRVGGVDRDRRRYFRTDLQLLPVPDVLALGKLSALPAVCPMVDVNVFMVDGNDRGVCLEPAANPPLDRPRVGFRSPDPSTVVVADRLFAEEPLPFAVEDAAEWRRQLASKNLLGK
jgi:hypothetical protein